MAENLSDLEYMLEMQKLFNDKDKQAEIFKSVQKSEANIDLIVAICQQEKTK